MHLSAHACALASSPASYTSAGVASCRALYALCICAAYVNCGVGVVAARAFVARAGFAVGFAGCFAARIDFGAGFLVGACGLTGIGVVGRFMDAGFPVGFLAGAGCSAAASRLVEVLG